MKLYREWTLKPEYRRGTMLTQSQIDLICKGTGDTGYASVYAFDENAAKTIIESKSSAGLARFEVYTDTLVMDLDGGEELRREATRKLWERGLGYTVWFSGSKGYHIVIKLDRMYCGKNIPYSQRVWVESLGIAADLSLYQHGRILSLPGRVHPKTGKRKECVEITAGLPLTLELKDPPTELQIDFKPLGGLGELEAGLWKMLQSLGDEPAAGNRHTRLWSTAQHFADAGVSYETSLELMNKVNESWVSAKDVSEVELAVSQAYKRNPTRRTT
jgi:hypothetical protein